MYVAKITVSNRTAVAAAQRKKAAFEKELARIRDARAQLEAQLAALAHFRDTAPHLQEREPDPEVRDRAGEWTSSPFPLSRLVPMAGIDRAVTCIYRDHDHEKCSSG